MHLNHFIYSIAWVILLHSPIFCMDKCKSSEVEIEMKDMTPQKPTLSGLIGSILQDSPQKCIQCKKDLNAADVLLFLCSFHNCAQLSNENCLMCFKKENQKYNSQNTSLHFDLYNLHDPCYIKLCDEVEKSTCSKCTQKNIKPKQIKTIKNKTRDKKRCACCAVIGASVACCCCGFKDCLVSCGTGCTKCLCSATFCGIVEGCCECFFGILEALTSAD